jgi:hypothetical protein
MQPLLQPIRLYCYIACFKRLIFGFKSKKAAWFGQPSSLTSSRLRGQEVQPDL